LLQMRGRAADCQDRHPLPIHFGDLLDFHRLGSCQK
jgi:hypothetical protein